LQDLREGRGDIKALEANLTGYYRLRVGKLRVICCYAVDGVIEVVFVEERSLVYEVGSSGNLVAGTGESTFK
jgi:mRNA interferase RelE/StbE